MAEESGYGEGEDEEDYDESSEEDEEYNERLDAKIENIKRGLKDPTMPNSDYITENSTVGRLEEAL